MTHFNNSCPDTEHLADIIKLSSNFVIPEGNLEVGQLSVFL